MSSGGGGGGTPKVADPVPIPVEVDIRARERDIQKRLKKATGRDVSTVAGFLSTPPMVSSLALDDVLG